MNPTIVRADPPRVADIARIHAHALPDDFLPSLGLDFLEEVYYPAALQSSHAATLAALIEDRVVGFVTIANDSPRFTHDVLHGKALVLARYAARAALRNPSHLLKSTEVFWSAVLTKPDPLPGEIVLIAVEQSYRGCGIGKRLVSASVDFLRQKGVSYCRTKTLARNLNVINMYTSMGWRVRDRFRLIGNEYVTLVSPPVE